MSSAPERKSRRGWLARSVIVVTTLLAAFVSCEIGFRIVEAVRLARTGELWAVYDPVLGWRLNPMHGDHNADGLRDRPLRPKEGRLRILMLGDSLLYYGDDLEDTLVGRLRADLRLLRDASTFDVLNAGVKGYTNWQELRFLEERGVAFEPDVVGVAFVLNDCYRMLHQFRVEDGRIVGQEYEFSDEAVRDEAWARRLARRSRFLVWVRRRLASAEPAGDGFTFDARPDFRAAWQDEPWTAIEAQMREMKELGLKRAFRVFLVAFPFGDQYRADYLARDRERVLAPQRRLADICARLGIPFLDLYGDLDSARDIDADRIHLTKAGRERAAVRIAAFLIEQRLF